MPKYKVITLTQVCTEWEVEATSIEAARETIEDPLLTTKLTFTSSMAAGKPTILSVMEVVDAR